MTVVVVFRSGVQARCRERALVLRAMGIEHEIVPLEHGYGLAVDAGDAVPAARQLEMYARENRGWPPRFVPFRPRSNGIVGTAIYLATLVGLAFVQTRSTLGYDWYGAGMMNAGLALDGQWWRPFTALTLHADLPHLIGNLLFGALFGLIASEMLGAGVAWSAIFAAGALGNIMNALVQAPTHTSVGASTAVFAALGLAAAFTWQLRKKERERTAYVWAPVIAGVVLLTFLGVGGERTDVVAHLTGFVAGGSLGALLGARDETLLRSPAHQALLGGATVAVLAAAWVTALTMTGP